MRPPSKTGCSALAPKAQSPAGPVNNRLRAELWYPPKRSFPVVLPDEVARDSRLDVRVHVAVEGRHPVAVNRRVALDNRGNFDVWRVRWRRGSAAAAAADDHKQAGQQRPAGQPLECLHADHFEGIKPDAGARIYQTKVLERAERRAFCLPPRRPSSSSKVSAKRGGGRPLPTQTPQIELTPWPPSGVERVCSVTRPSL